MFCGLQPSTPLGNYATHGCKNEFFTFHLQSLHNLMMRNTHFVLYCFLEFYIKRSYTHEKEKYFYF